jgi:hypothetical protein
MHFNKFFLSLFLSVFLVFTGQKNIAAFVDSNIHIHHFSKSGNKAFSYSYSENIDNSDEKDFFFDEELDSDDDHTQTDYLYLSCNKHSCISSFNNKDRNPKKWYRNNVHLFNNNLRRYILFCSLKLDYQELA